MTGYTAVVLHAVAAGAFFFLFQRFGLSASLQDSAIWGGAAAVAAAWLAHRQQFGGK